MRFGPYEADFSRRILRRDGRIVALGAKPFALLEVLVREAPDAVSHEVARRHLWPETHVAASNLRVQLWSLRRALGDDAARPSYIETLAGAGYRVIAPLDRPGPSAEAAATGRSRRGFLRLAATGLVGLAAGGLGGVWWSEDIGEFAATPPIGYERSPGYGAYLSARKVWQARSRQGIDAAIAGYRRALRLDADLAPAMAGLAEAHLTIAISHVGPSAPRESFRVAARWARQALRLDDRLAVAHSVLGHSAFLSSHDLDRAESHYRRAAALAPEEASAWQRYGWFLLTAGRERVAERAFGRALLVDRVGANANAALGLFYYCRRAWRAAERQLEVTREIHPDFGPLWLEIARLRDARGDHAGAIAALEKVRRLMGEESEVLAALAFNRARDGDRPAARRLQARLEQAAAYTSPYHRAVAALGLGEIERAERLLEGSWRDRSLWIPWLRFDHRLAPLVGAGTLGHFLERLGLPAATSVDAGR